jgi:hypothetical protein
MTRGRQPTRRPAFGRAGQGPPVSEAGRRLIILLAVVAGALLVLVALKYWPPWIGEVAERTLAGMERDGTRIWRETGGRWVTLLALTASVAIGLLLMRRHRVAGLSLIEVAVAVCALVALVQPSGW